MNKRDRAIKDITRLEELEEVSLEQGELIEAEGAEDLEPAAKVAELPEDGAPIDWEKTVVIPAGVMPAASEPVEPRVIDFGEAVGDFDESHKETPQLPPLSEEAGNKDDSQAASQGVYLGWTAWLGKPPDDRDLDDLYIE